ncbi:unnamed protein product [Urochloa decumbens]|uniref:Thioesterase domain-containing protein n=1 Tax=Urochloa decumbens TaxID=240449 RepID=A0ABC8YTB3_9POAL
MGDEAKALRLAAIARKWLKDPRVGYSGDLNPAASDSERQALSSMVMAGAHVSVAEPGRVVCSLRVRAPLTDAEGRWHPGAIAAAVDNACSAAVFTVEGAPTVTVQYSMSYFSPAYPDVRGSRDGGASGEPEGEADGCGSGGAQEGVRRAGGDREAVDDACLANQEQQKQQALSRCEISPCSLPDM